MITKTLDDEAASGMTIPSAPHDVSSEWRIKLRENFLRLVVTVLGMFLGAIVALFVGVLLGWIPVFIC